MLLRINLRNSFGNDEPIYDRFIQKETLMLRKNLTCDSTGCKMGAENMWVILCDIKLEFDFDRKEILLLTLIYL
jgi:hypothetical protein